MKLLIWLVTVIVLSGCASSLKSFNSSAEVDRLSRDETILWHEANEFDTSIRKAKLLFPDARLANYTQNVMDRLFPDYKGHIRTAIVDSPTYNAFALPNGSVYIHLGLLNALQNEAQLAAVLSHEGAHFLHKHGAKQAANLDTARTLNLLMLPTGPLALLTAAASMSSIYGHSRDAEREADQEGFDRYRRAGYPTDQASGAFLALLREIKDLDIEEPFFFATHPSLQARIDNYHTLH